MKAELTPAQTLLLWCLLVKQGIAAQKDLRPAPKAADRKKLELAKMVRVEKRGRSIWLHLEDEGWGWAAENLTAELPINYSVLRDLMRRLASHLAAQDLPLAEFIGTAPEPPPEPAKPPKKTSGGKSKSAAAKSRSVQAAAPSASPSPEDLRDRIERVYLEVTKGRKGQEAPLADIRAKLAPLDRATVDAGLRRILAGDPKARLIRIDDPRAIREVDSEAAFNPAGEPYHILWIME